VLLFRQFVNDDLGCASYLVGDSEAGVAVVVDPPFAIEPLVAAAADEHLRLERVLETHTHADHVSGHGRLALEHGLPVCVHPLAEVEFDSEPIADGDIIRVGSIPIRVLHTPGHRPEHCSFVIDERMVLTGDSLFVGDAARPDLAVAAREGAEDLYASLSRLGELPPAVEVFPVRNAAASPLRYEMDPKDQLAVFEALDDAELDVGAIYHSHTRSDPLPSQTDINLAFYPDALYVIVGVKDPGHDDVRTWRIVDGKVSEAPLEVEEG